MGLTIWQVDAFTDRPFTGNPAGVCILPGPRDAAWYQAVANEMNLSETAFLHAGGDEWALRWFTPSTEVDLCGHATLASAHVLWEAGHLPPDAAARFTTRSGMLTAERIPEQPWITLDFPATPPEARAAPEGLERILGTPPSWVGASRFDLLVELDSVEAVERLTPDLEGVTALPFRGIIVTAQGSPTGGAHPEVDFVSRFFGPAAGVPEDPVTGSAHCALAPYWGSRLGRTALVGRQVSARGGTVRVEVAGERVRLSGQAITVMRAELLVV